MFKRCLILSLMLIIGLFAITSCDKDNGTTPEPVNEFQIVATQVTNYLSNYITPTNRSVNTTIQAVFDVLNDGNTDNDPFIIDYRSATEYNNCHIRGAVNIALSSLVSKIDDGTVPKTKAILNVCYTGQNSSTATALLNMLGYDAQSLQFGMCAVDTSLLEGGRWLAQIAADEHAGDLVSQESTTTQTYEFPVLSTGKGTAEEIIKAKFQASGWTITANDVWDNRSNYFIINYWPSNMYTAPGHIPGAYQFTPNTSLKTTEKLNLLPTDKTVVVYCYTGQTSAQVATVLRILGYDARSLTFGHNGFAYMTYASARYTAPAAGTYDAILVKQ